jgi:hypothetical protein
MCEKIFAIAQKHLLHICIFIICWYMIIFQHSQVTRLIHAVITAFINLMNNIVAKDAFSTLVISGIVALAGKHYGKRKVKVKHETN